jgi:hypothetical protein
MTSYCADCGIEIPAGAKSQLLHLFRQHPALFQQVEREYCTALGELNDIHATPISTEGGGDLQDRIDEAAARAIATGGQQ